MNANAFNNIAQSAQSGLGQTAGAMVQRPIARLEATRVSFQTCVKLQEELNERLVALANGLCGGHPTNRETDQVPQAIPTGMVDELDSVARGLSAQQMRTAELIARLSEAIPEIR